MFVSIQSFAQETCIVTRNDVDQLYSRVITTRSVSNLMSNTAYDYGYWIGSNKKKFPKDNFLINEFENPVTSYKQMSKHYKLTQDKLDDIMWKIHDDCLKSLGIIPYKR